MREETKGKLQNSEFISPNTFILGTIQVSHSSMRKPTPTLLGLPTVKLGKFIQLHRPGAQGKEQSFY